MKPDEKWGPALPEHRTGRYAADYIPALNSTGTGNDSVVFYNDPKNVGGVDLVGWTTTTATRGLGSNLAYENTGYDKSTTD